MNETLTTILSTVVTRRRTSPEDSYVTFGTSPPVGPTSFNILSGLLGLYRIQWPDVIYNFPPLEKVRKNIWSLPQGQSDFRDALRALAALGLATVRECLACGQYVNELLEQYPDHAKELYGVYFEYHECKRFDMEHVLPKYLSECQMHALCEDISRYYYISRYWHRVAESICSWGGHDPYCSVTARLAYM